jgi:2'-5' RNA ligase
MGRGTLRLFFALWPDAAARAAMAPHARRIAARCGGREVATRNLHLTLAFLGERSHASALALGAGAAALKFERFRLTLDQAGSWRRAGVAWLGSSKAPPALTALHRSLLTMLAAEGTSIEPMHYLPHVTVARHITSPIAEPLEKPIEWAIDALCLVVSELAPAGSQYEVMGSWPARG